MLIASLVVDEGAAVVPRSTFVDIEGVWLTPTSPREADRLIEALRDVRKHLAAAEEAQSMRLPEDDGPVAAITESELRALAGDR